MSDASRPQGKPPVRVMIVDDSAIIRGLYRRIVAEEPDLEIVADASNGQMAIDRLKTTHVDAVIMDIEMPVMDGLSAIPGLLQVDPSVCIIMSSTLTERNAEAGLKAIKAGAKDYVQKPTSKADVATDGAFRLELVNKVKSLGRVSQNDPTRKARPGVKTTSSAAAPVAPRPKPAAGPVSLRSPGRSKPRILVVGSSTGGPQALDKFFSNLDRSLKMPILVVQHMPPKFTTILCSHIQSASGWPCREAVDGDKLVPGEIRMAPGGYHMVIAGSSASPVLKLNEDPPENFCRPAVDPMFRSASKYFGADVLGVVLTGMGNDGAKGGQVIVDGGGTVIAQDEATSVVWGMPGAAAAAGICAAVLPLAELPGKVKKLTMGMAA